MHFFLYLHSSSIFIFVSVSRSSHVADCSSAPTQSMASPLPNRHNGHESHVSVWSVCDGKHFNRFSTQSDLPSVLASFSRHPYPDAHSLVRATCLRAMLYHNVAYSPFFIVSPLQSFRTPILPDMPIYFIYYFYRRCSPENATTRRQWHI